MIVVGEASGDAHAARLIESLREKEPDAEFEFFGATGEKMRVAGTETIVEADQFAISGVPEVAKALPMFWRVFKKLKEVAVKRKPDAVILIDFPDMNLRLAKACKKNGLKVVYYISPQVWAWKKYRIRTIRRYVDLLLAILPFEKNWYRERGVEHVKYVGNPLAGDVKSQLNRKQFCEKHGLDSAKPIVALLAGSRKSETERILPLLVETSCEMAGRDPDMQFVFAVAPTRKKFEVRDCLSEFKENGYKLPEHLVIVQGETYEAIVAADVAGVTSGTATLETAILGTPLAIVYKASRLNYALLRPLISIEHFGLVNLIAQRKLAKELIQDDFTAESLSAELFRLLESDENQKMRIELKEIKESLGDDKASMKAAVAILDEIRN